MKKDRQERIYLPVTGKDEFNLCECPFTLLTNKPNKEQATLKFTDRQHTITRHWKIIGSAEYGLPTALDEPVFIAMLFLTKQDGFNNPKVFFNQHEMLQLMKWPINGEHYHRLKLSFNRLVNVGIETDYLWDKGEFKKGNYTFHILEDKFLYDGKVRNIKSSWFTWGKILFTSFEKGNLKDLNLDAYFNLSTAISRRLFRLCTKRLYKNDQITFDLLELCHEKLGISRNFVYPSSLKQKLKPAIEEHKTKKLLSSAIYTKTKSGKWLLTVKKYENRKNSVIEINDYSVTRFESNNQPINDQTKINPLVNQLTNLGIAKRVAGNLINTINPETIENQIGAFQYRKNIEDKSGFLIRAIQENYPLPQAFKKKLAAREYEKEARLKDEYKRFVISQVDEYLKTVDPQQVEQEIESHEKIFFEKYPHYKEFRLETVRSYIKYDYERTKAVELHLPTFEEWKKVFR